jgi:phosphatidylglycerol:prolipoprotein diacylglycerol transferase
MLTLLDAWLHTIDPYVVWPIRWYGLSYLAGFLIGYLMLRLVTTRGRSPLRTEQVGDLVVTLAICGVIGGRLGYVFFYKPSLLTTVSDQLPYWGPLMIQDGGMASHGGMIGAVLGCFFYALRHHISPLFLGDLLAFGAPLGLALGRVANFINGELVGRMCSPDFALAVKFPTAMRFWSAEKVDQLMRAYEATGHAVLTRTRGQFVEYAIARVQAGDADMIQVVRPLLEPRHPSQLYAALGEGVFVGLVLLWLYRKPRHPGVVGFSFLIAYGIARIINEFWRKPDAHIGFDAVLMGWQITRGQWLSIAMLAIGVVGVIVCARRGVERLGGWQRSNCAGSLV